MAKYRCPKCDYESSSSTGFGNHIRMKATNGDEDHQELYNEDSDAAPQEDQEVEQDGDKNLVDEWQENNGEDENMQVKEISTETQSSDDSQSEWRKLSSMEEDELPEIAEKLGYSVQDTVKAFAKAQKDGKTKVNLSTGEFQ
jgi:hypothetical protein